MINSEKAQILAKIGQLAVSLQQASMVNLAPYQWYIERKMDKAQELLYAFQILEIPVSLMKENEEDDDFMYGPEDVVLIGKEVPPGVIFILASVLKEVYGERGIGMYISYAWDPPEMISHINIGYVIEQGRPHHNLSKRFEPTDILILPLTMMTFSELQSHFPNLIPNEKGYLLADFPEWEQEMHDESEREREAEESEWHNYELRKDADSWMDNDALEY
jgi:hypothetical protein